MNQPPSRKIMTKEYIEKQKRRRIALKRAKRWQRYKLPLMAIVFAFIFGYFLLQIYGWQTLAGQEYAIRTMNQVLNRHGSDDRIISPNRGSITDRNFQTLAMSSIAYNIFVDVRMLNQRGEVEFNHNMAIFRDFFEMSPLEIEEMLARDTHYFVIQRLVPYSQMINFQDWVADRDYLARQDERRFFTRDIHFEEQSRRNYVHSHLAAPILGFQRGLWWGLEHQYDNFLVGYSGRHMTTVNPDGNISTDRIAATHGANIVTTLDLNIQRYAEDVVARWAGGRAGHGSVIVMNPHTGEILAMAQYPSFDANNPASISSLTTNQTEHLSTLDPTSQEFVDYLFRIWANFNISGTFEPGSTYKAITMAKALDLGLVSPNQTFYCRGFRDIAGHRIRCSSYRRGGLGLINLTQALALSCNTAHMYIAEAIGRENFWNYQRDFGFGTVTGIDLPGENPGLVFTPAELNPAELATSSFGQRFTVTPLQAVASFAPLINGGYVVRPHVVSQVVDGNNNSLFVQDTTPQRQVVSAEVSNWMRGAMAYTVTAGTARSAAISGFSQGGKTGTAEQGLQEEPGFTWSLSYIGYFPLENPQYLILTLLHEVPPAVFSAGTTNTLTMHREMVQEIIRLNNIPPDLEGATQQETIPESEIVGNFVGLPVQQAINAIGVTGRGYTLAGSGNIVLSQFPPAGVRASMDFDLVLYLTPDGETPLVAVPDVIGQPLSFARDLLEQR
ncbi:MAG: penicillin-binding transpeptidase domain-containing protein, partial [Defluviitaleaceae bacterium]|nr:penicillin-binding transpeptidase domain-containing protein [Defluviitaleaceae bacterium]